MQACIIESLKVGDIKAEKCLEIEATKLVKSIRSCAQMYKHRKRKKEPEFNASYRVYKVVGAVILERTK